MAKDLCWNRYAYNRKFPVNYLITEKFTVDLSPLQLRHENNHMLNTIPDPLLSEKAVPLMALIIPESKSKVIMNYQTLPKLVGKRNPHNSMSIRHHLR